MHIPVEMGIGLILPTYFSHTSASVPKQGRVWSGLWLQSYSLSPGQQQPPTSRPQTEWAVQCCGQRASWAQREEYRPAVFCIILLSPYPLQDETSGVEHQKRQGRAPFSVQSGSVHGLCSLEQTHTRAILASCSIQIHFIMYFVTVGKSDFLFPSVSFCSEGTAACVTSNVMK